MSCKSLLTHSLLTTVVLDEHLMPIPLWAGWHCYHITMEIPKVPPEKPIQVLQIITASMGKAGEMTPFAVGRWVEWAMAKQRGSPWSWWKKLMGKAPILCGTREWEHFILTRVSPGGAGGDTQHLETFVAVTSSMAPKSANLLCIPNTQDTICNLQSVWVEGGSFAPFMSWFMTCLLVCLTHTANIVIKPC